MTTDDQDISNTSAPSGPRAEHSPGPWIACRDGECKCGQVWSTVSDHPVATVVSGTWGDTYPTLRFVGESSFDRKAEPYIEKIEYGEVNPEVAKANARLIAGAPDLLAALTELCELESMKERANMMGEWGLQMYFDYKRRKPEAWKRALEVFEKYRTDKKR